MAAPRAISPTVRKWLQRARVARLATVGPGKQPHLIPICFVFDGRAFYSALDLKPKRRAFENLQRVRNIRANPAVALLIDGYSEDWQRLWYVQVRGRARLLRSGARWKQAHRLLRRKYRQYRTGLLPGDAPVIEIIPQCVVAWGRL